VRATTAFNRILGIAGATVVGVTFTPEGIVVDLRRRRRKLVCPCGWKTWAVHGRRVRRWRHLDLGGARLWLQAEVRRLECRRCRRVRGNVNSIWPHCDGPIWPHPPGVFRCFPARFNHVA